MRLAARSAVENPSRRNPIVSVLPHILLVSGDAHLLGLGEADVVSPRDFLDALEP
jgi:hypothetical protein